MLIVPATELSAAVGQDSQHRDAVGLEERQHAVVEQVSGRQRGLRRVDLRRGPLRAGVDERLLADAAHALQRAHVEGVLGSEMARTFGVHLARPMTLQACATLPSSSTSLSRPTLCLMIARHDARII
jgi:hypothetical protein